MGVFVKICGCASGRDVEAVAALKPAAMGFILWPGSKRYVQPEQVAEWCESVSPEIVRVGVFVNATPDQIRAAMDVAGLDIVQLHGGESADVPRLLQPLRCWKVIHLNRPLPADVASYEVDAFLVDYQGVSQPGGTGQAVDWQEARRFSENAGRKVVLAGGLNRDNVQAAIEQVRPWGVDVSSGVEHSPGKKDIEKVKDFIEQCRATA